MKKKILAICLILTLIISNASVAFAGDSSEKTLYLNPSVMVSDEDIMKNAVKVKMDSKELAQYYKGLPSEGEFLYSNGTLTSVESIDKKVLKQLVSEKLKKVDSREKVVKDYIEDSLVTVNFVELNVPLNERANFVEGSTYSVATVSQLTYDKSYSGCILRNTTQFNESTYLDDSTSFPIFALVNVWGKVIQMNSGWTATQMTLHAQQWGSYYDIDGFYLGSNKLVKDSPVFSYPVLNQAYKLVVQNPGSKYYESFPDFGTQTYTTVTIKVSNGFTIQAYLQLSST